MNPLLGPLEEVDPENLDFFEPNGTLFARCHFRAQKIPSHVINKYINSYYHTSYEFELYEYICKITGYIAQILNQ
jgi:hypothetical protein